MLSSQTPHYEACEPHPETNLGLQNLIGWLTDWCPELAGRAQVRLECAESALPSDRVDMVLTSPPYWKRET